MSEHLTNQNWEINSSQLKSLSFRSWLLTMAASVALSLRSRSTEPMAVPRSCRNWKALTPQRVNQSLATKDSCCWLQIDRQKTKLKLKLTETISRPLFLKNRFCLCFSVSHLLFNHKRCIMLAINIENTVHN